MRYALTFVALVAIAVVVVPLFLLGRSVAVKDREPVVAELRAAHGQWVTLGISGKDLIQPLQGWLDARSVDDGYVVLTYDGAPEVIQLGRVRWVDLLS